MENNLIFAFQLLVIGILTVYVILLIVIGLGKALIYFVNKYLPAEAPAKKVTPSVPESIDSQTRDIIQAAVSQLTGGKGKAVKIQKL